MENYISDERIHEGHRGRMRSKLLTHGQRIFDTYELLEMLLYQVIPFRDTNPVAKRLLYAFGGLDGVLSAAPDRLTEIPGVGRRTAEFLSSVGRLSSVIGAELLPEREGDFSDYEAVGRYLVKRFSGESGKCVLALFLDSGMRLIKEKRMFEVDYESAGVKPKAFIDEALSCSASVVITAHNHPYGPFYPTPGDRETNKAVSEGLDAAGFIHAEHYIISGEHYAGIGSLMNFNLKLSQTTEVNDFLRSRQQHCAEVRTVSSLTSADGDWQGAEGGIGYNTRDLDYFVSLAESCDCITRDMAQELLRQYRTVENVFTAGQRELILAVGERGAFYLKLLAYVTSRRVTDGFVFGERHSDADVAEYLKGLYLGESVEKIYMLIYDSNDRITDCVMLGEGTVNASEILPRKAIEVAVTAGASSVSIAHNHPFGTVRASDADVNFTEGFSRLFMKCGLKLREHYVIAGQLCNTVQMNDGSND